MTEPIRIKCNGKRDIPDVQELRRMADSAHHVVLEFPCSPWGKLDKEPIITALAGSLTEYSVFDSGGNQKTEWITVMPVVSRAEVLGRVDSIRGALDGYIRACATLISQREATTLSPEWAAEEHGGDVRFENEKTGQVVEAPLSGELIIGQVDPYFFAVFIRTTAGFADVVELLNNDFHDARRILEILKDEEAQRGASADSQLPSRQR